MASNGGYTNGDVESPNAAGPNEGCNNHSREHDRNQTKEVLELNYRNSKHSAICSIVVFLALILILATILFVLIFFVDGPGSSQPEIEMQVEVEGQYVVAASITIQNLDFRESLSDRNSKEYRDLEDQVNDAVSTAIAGTELKDKYAALEIYNVRSGSVIVDFVVVFCNPFMTESDIIQTVQDALETINSNSTTKGNLEIDNSQLSVEAASRDDLTKLRGTFCEPSVPTITPTGTPPVTPTAGVSSFVSPTPTSSQLKPTLSSDAITPTPSSQSATPTVTPTPSSSFVTTEVPGTTTKVPSMTTLMSSTLIETKGITTTPSPTTTLPTPSTQIVTTPLTTSFITPTTITDRISSTITPSMPSSVRISKTSILQHTSTSVILPTPLPSTTIQMMVTTPETTVITSSTPTPPVTSPLKSTTTVPIMTSSEVPTTQTPSTSPSITTTPGKSTEEVSTQVPPPVTVPLTVCSESSRFFNPSIFLNSTDVLDDGTPVNFQCSWNYIVAVPDGRIRVQFLVFDVGNDLLEVDLSDSRTETYTGSNIPPELTTNAHMVRFTLKTDLQTNPINFSIFLQIILPENRVTGPMLNASTAVAGPTTLPGCSPSAQLIRPGPPTTITSPGYPRGYLTDLMCTWQFIATGANQGGILLEFVNFDLGDDVLEVTSSDASFFRQLTGSQLPAPISTSTNQLQLRFISDDADTATGFEVTIQVIEPNPPCVPSHMFVNSDQSRVVTSPGYPINYGPNLVCSWTLQSTQPNSQIIITFLNFDVSDDLLQVIYPGVVLQFSGSLLPMPVTVSSDRVELQFTSNGEIQSPGFQLEVSVQLPVMTTPGSTPVLTSSPQQNILSTTPYLDCTPSTVLLTAASDPKTFTSPGYPNHNYGPESGCSWSFTLVDNTKVIRLQFVSFDVGNDVVRVDYGAGISKMLTGSNLPDEITTTGNMLSVELGTSSQSNYPGFEAIVSVVDR